MTEPAAGAHWLFIAAVLRLRSYINVALMRKTAEAKHLEASRVKTAEQKGVECAVNCQRP